MQDELDELRSRVKAWETRVWRPYPWRVNPSPYRVMIAQFLLRRTTRTAVARKYPSLIAKYPNVYALARASTEELEEELRDIGLYRVRARQLKAAAQYIVVHHGGVVPNTWHELLEVPGLGPYGAGAVLSFGYGIRAPVVDSNSGRVIARLAGLNKPKLKVLLEIAWLLVPEEGHDVFNYGMVDLGAYVCTPRGPRCSQCPVSELCAHYGHPVLPSLLARPPLGSSVGDQRGRGSERYGDG